MVKYNIWQSLYLKWAAFVCFGIWLEMLAWEALVVEEKESIWVVNH